MAQVTAGQGSEPSSEPSSVPSSEPSSVPSSEPSSVPSSEPSSVPSSEPVPAGAALQAALAAENAAIFGYGVAGAHLSGSRKTAAEQYWTGHNQARDTLTAMIAALGVTPVAAQAFYQLPFGVHDAASAMALAAYLEDGVTRAYLGIVAVSDQRLRTFGALAMQRAAERAAFWRGSTVAFPGLQT
jgi:Domain of unknown function (DUF4439)